MIRSVSCLFLIMFSFPSDLAFSEEKRARSVGFDLTYSNFMQKEIEQIFSMSGGINPRIAGKEFRLQENSQADVKIFLDTQSFPALVSDLKRVGFDHKQAIEKAKFIRSASSFRKPFAKTMSENIDRPGVDLIFRNQLRYGAMYNDVNDQSKRICVIKYSFDDYCVDHLIQRKLEYGHTEMSIVRAFLNRYKYPRPDTVLSDTEAKSFSDEILKCKLDLDSARSDGENPDRLSEIDSGKMKKKANRLGDYHQKLRRAIFDCLEPEKSNVPERVYEDEAWFCDLNQRPPLFLRKAIKAADENCIR